MSRVEEVLRRTRGPDILDIGCSGQLDRHSALDSPWWLHGQLVRRFPGTWGLEFSQRLVNDLATFGIKNIHHGDAQQFDLGRQFDTVVAGELIEHLENPGDFLRCAVAHLKPAGRIILTTPYVFSLGFVLYSWARFPRTCSNPEHTLWLCPTTITQLVERVGLEVEECLLVDHYRTDLPTRNGRVAGRLMRTIGRLLPQRMRANSMVVVVRRPV